MTRFQIVIAFAGISLALMGGQLAPADDWPMFRKDVGRTGITAAPLRAEYLQLAWEWKAGVPPEPAWDGPARWDAYNLIRDLPAMRQYDLCFHPVSDGETVYFGSSSQDTLTALDLRTGKLDWNYVAGGPIRLAPTIYKDKILFGCDDGFAYCLNRANGELIWRFSPSRSKDSGHRYLINNGRVISHHPVRTGITVQDGIAYFGASFLPWNESFVCAVDVNTGAFAGGEGTYVSTQAQSTLEGNLLVANNRLIVPQGRVAPVLFDRSTGNKLGTLPGGGGVTIVLTEGGDVIRTEGGKAARKGQVGVFRGKKRVASFPRGRSIVVNPESYFVIDGEKLFAAKRASNELVWKLEIDEPLELIMAGSTLFVGGRDHVTAVDSNTGMVVWSAEAKGRVAGLAVAGNRLITSTDRGVISVYEATAKSKYENTIQQNHNSPDANWQSPPIQRVREQNLIHRWVFHRSGMQNSSRSMVSSTELKNIVVKDQASSTNLTLKGSAKVVRISEAEKLEATELNGQGTFPLSDKARESLPSEAITVSAWVRIDEPETWGGIVGCIQDDGATEHGWLLGYRGEQFCFALAGRGTGLTYVKASQSFEKGHWYHVAGTYNGREMRLYVNGTLTSSSKAEQGPINYSAKSFFTVGSYRDINENFPMKGALQEIRIYSKALPATLISRTFLAQADAFDIKDPIKGQSAWRLAWGPYLRFVSPAKIEFSYGTNEPCETIVDLIQEHEVKRFGKNAKTREHRLIIEGLPFRRILQYQIRKNRSEDSQTTEAFTLDTHFDWTSQSAEPAQEDLHAIIEQAPNPRGLVYVVGLGHEKIAKTLAQQSRFRVILVGDSQLEVEAIRKRWLGIDSAIYGAKLTAMAVEVDELPGASAAIVISDFDVPSIRRLVRPAGGILVVEKKVVWKRAAIAGAGSWGHMYGSIDNSAFAGEHLSDVTEKDDLVTQWIGRPGPRYKTDRQNRRPSPLAVGGRMYLNGHQRIITVDAFSGAVLWSVETPSVMRWNMPRDCANWCADEDGLFVVAEDQAWLLDGGDGSLVKKYQIPATEISKAKAAWGYVGRYKDHLIGSQTDPQSSYKKWWSSSQWFDSTGGNDTHVVAGKQLFSLDVKSGKPNWQYQGLVLHPTITILDDCIYFVESKTPEHLANRSGRLSIGQNQQLELVCLRVHNGKRLWKRPLPSFNGHISVLYLAGGGNDEYRSLVMVASEATQQQFTLSSFELETGKTRWSRAVKWESNHHGKHISRPAIQGDLVYLRPEVLNLKNGETIHRGFPNGHGCSSYSLSTNGLFSRLGETTWWDARTSKVNRFDRLRTDCWLSVIPAQGMLLSAEGGGGCSCGSWMETSIGFLPKIIHDQAPKNE